MLNTKLYNVYRDEKYFPKGISKYMNWSNRIIHDDESLAMGKDRKM